ncbi:MAG: hypothetical protein C4530_11865 [Desulfobacteraceae bacterium]|nr:MAG: hypothetical protein C4530_11865 [Desulfobacteraceae bacterium]
MGDDPCARFHGREPGTGCGSIASGHVSIFQLIPAHIEKQVLEPDAPDGSMGVVAAFSGRISNR